MKSVLESKLYDTIVDLLWQGLAILLIFTAVGFLTIPFYFNHWIEIWRILLFVISFVIGCFVIILFNSFYSHYNHDPLALFFIILLLALEFGIAGIRMHRGFDTYDIRSGQIQENKGSGWDWPWTRSDVTLSDTPKEIKTGLILFPDKILKVEMKLSWRNGTSVALLQKKKILVFGGSSEERNNGFDDLNTGVNIALQRVLLNSEFSNKKILGKKEKKRYLRLAQQEILKDMPKFFKIDGKPKISLITKDN